MLLKLLRERRCLVVLDNFESVLGSDEHTAGAQHDEAGFADVVRMLAESSHQSCVLLTSREGLVNLDPLVGETGGVRAMMVQGVSVDEARVLLGEDALRGDDRAWADLVETYAGNSLALKVTSQTIQQVFGGDISAFIAYVKETYGTAVRGIRRMMDAQVERRLSKLELDVLRWRSNASRPRSSNCTPIWRLPPTAGLWLKRSRRSGAAHSWSGPTGWVRLHCSRLSWSV
jgi:hypothetical protein